MATTDHVFAIHRRIKYGDMVCIWEVTQVRESGVVLALFNNTISPHEHFMKWEELEAAGVEFIA